jgi:hypothetical protein
MHDAGPDEGNRSSTPQFSRLALDSQPSAKVQSIGLPAEDMADFPVQLRKLEPTVRPDAARMVEGPGRVFICEGCIDLCRSIMDQTKWKNDDAQ